VPGEPIDIGQFVYWRGSQLILEDDREGERLAKGVLAVLGALPLIALIVSGWPMAVLAAMMFGIPALLIFFVRANWTRSLDPATKRMTILRPLLPIRRDLSQVERVVITRSTYRRGRHTEPAWLAEATIAGRRQRVHLLAAKTREITADQFTAMVSAVCGAMRWPLEPLAPQPSAG
jgi:hypothetical protein